MQAVSAEMTKADFARHMGVSRAAVSQWIAKGIIKLTALRGEGRKARIIVAVAVDQVRRNRDVGQSIGNGMDTRTSSGAQAVPIEASVPQPELPSAPVDVPPERIPQELAADRPDTVEDQLKKAKLQSQNFTNRRLAEEEALRRETLMSSDDAREQMTRIAGMMMQIFEGSLPELASAVAEKFSVPQRDVLHLMRAEFVNVRATAAMKEKARGAASETVVDVALE